MYIKNGERGSYKAEVTYATVHYRVQYFSLDYRISVIISRIGDLLLKFIYLSILAHYTIHALYTLYYTVL
jgi:hypothetical protein